MKTPTEPTKPFPFHLTEERLAAYKQAAKQKGMTLSAWLRSLADDAVEQIPAEVLKPVLDPLKILKGAALAEFCRVNRIANPEAAAAVPVASFWSVPPPPPVPVDQVTWIDDEPESKADRREREAMERRGIA